MLGTVDAKLADVEAMASLAPGLVLVRNTREFQSPRTMLERVAIAGGTATAHTRLPIAAGDAGSNANIQTKGTGLPEPGSQEPEKDNSGCSPCTRQMQPEDAAGYCTPTAQSLNPLDIGTSDGAGTAMAGDRDSLVIELVDPGRRGQPPPAATLDALGAGTDEVRMVLGKGGPHLE